MEKPPVQGYAEVLHLPGDHNTCALSPDGRTLAYGGDDGVLYRRTLATGEESVEQFRSGVVDCVFAPDGSLAVALAEGVVRWGDRTIEHTGVRSCAIANGLLITGSSDGTVVLDGSRMSETQGEGLRRLAANATIVALPTDSGVLIVGQRELHFGPVATCAISPSGLWLAATTVAGELLMWELDDGSEPPDVLPGAGYVGACAFSADGRVVLAAGDVGVQGFDVETGELLGTSDGTPLGHVWRCASGPNGLVAVASASGTAVYEPIVGHVTLAAVAPDSLDGVDLLGATGDAAALADVIAAKTTEPPLSIGLFADWGSGKSFLIKLVQERVRNLSRRASANPDAAAHCAHVRNVEFNAWHFADANLWASLASHIFETLARAEDGEPDRTAAKQLARLEEEIAAQSETGRQLRRARKQAQEADARRRIALLALGREGVQTVSDLRDAWTWVRVALGVLFPLLLVAGLAVALFGLDAVVAAVAAAVAAVPTFLAAAKQVRGVLARAGDATPVESVKQATADADAARAREAELRREYEDLAHGRALARYVADRDAAGDYRAQLGLISRIHDDFERMSKLLRERATPPAGKPSELPPIDRIVLYIDDLDRCSPKRVVEVLEAVHLILALKLFVVVLAVDPRWLLQSLKLHYAQLLTGNDKAEWESTPLNYLDKIIQIPFTLRPMGDAGTTSLVHNLLPVEAPAQPVPASVPRTGTVAVGELRAAEAPTPAALVADVARTPPLLNPRRLVLTEEERDFAALVACELRTPRAVKKLTNIYRLVRVRIDDQKRFLATNGGEMPEFQAVLILLTVLVQHPGLAPKLLLQLDGEPILWSRLVVDARLRDFHTRTVKQAINGTTTSTAPFRRHARELARYSFEAGQEVFAKR